MEIHAKINGGDLVLLRLREVVRFSEGPANKNAAT